MSFVKRFAHTPAIRFLETVYWLRFNDDQGVRSGARATLATVDQTSLRGLPPHERVSSRSWLRLLTGISSAGPQGCRAFPEPFARAPAELLASARGRRQATSQGPDKSR
ncbi:hypothetical protein [Candidatus Nitronereus thalassa]|uniref:Uncharacterized protein n=1 Tax=Candidatus Nitronereus thalassa TaxID=3020898 RepID=A0ABU3KCH1_9BACT|nr:hypothetical protein [Candidatus Nitronereus thalassa]MDT7044215.1 hypothetical protein [Candidatus Nitronereus thalassa]